MTYIINKNSDSKGYNEVHKATCSYLPSASNRVLLGTHATDYAAVRYAKQLGWTNADGCAHCCPTEHHG